MVLVSGGVGLGVDVGVGLEPLAFVWVAVSLNTIGLGVEPVVGEDVIEAVVTIVVFTTMRVDCEIEAVMERDPVTVDVGVSEPGMVGVELTVEVSEIVTVIEGVRELEAVMLFEMEAVREIEGEAVGVLVADSDCEGVLETENETI